VFVLEMCVVCVLEMCVVCMCVRVHVCVGDVWCVCVGDVCGVCVLEMCVVCVCVGDVYGVCVCVCWRCVWCVCVCVCWRCVCVCVCVLEMCVVCGVCFGDVGLVKNVGHILECGCVSGYMKRIAWVGQNLVKTVYVRYFWQGKHHTYGHIRCVYMVRVLGCCFGGSWGHLLCVAVYQTDSVRSA